MSPAGRVTTRTREPKPATRYSGQQDGGGEKKYETATATIRPALRRGHQLAGTTRGPLIFGPGEAKLQLKERLSRSKALSDRIVGIETTDKLTDPQIIAKVKAHYGIEASREER